MNREATVVEKMIILMVGLEVLGPIVDAVLELGELPTPTGKGKNASKVEDKCMKKP